MSEGRVLQEGKRISVTDWRQSELVIEDQSIYAEYEISVGAENDEGPSLTSLVQYSGHSGQAGTRIYL